MELKFDCKISRKLDYNAFNRTKWNWNEYFAYNWLWISMLLIVLNGIEICFDGQYICLNGTFNRTKWNWNFGKSVVSLDTGDF